MPAAPANTLLELLEVRAEQCAEKPLFTFVEDAPGEEAVLGYSELWRRARSIGAALQQTVAAGERAVLLYPPGLEYVAGFFGCLAANVVAVPAYPPDPLRLERTLPRLRAIIQDAQATVVLTTSFILSMGEMLFESAPDLRALRWMATDELPAALETDWRPPELTRESLAFLQYTSGSTGTPKGVELTHGNLLHNLRLIHGAFGMHPRSAGVIWLPPYHDMGLIGGILGTLHGGFSTSLMSPMTFLRRPLRWLEEVSRTGGTISGGPNFAFDLCVRKTTEAERQTLDLSRWQVAFCGAEPIRPETLERFVQAFAPSGFRREAFYPCYGLAEGTLIVTGGRVGVPPVLQPLDVERLREGRGVPAEASSPRAQTLVGCGPSLEDQRVLVVRPETGTPSEPGAVGEIWVKGPSVARGYWAQPEATRRDFQAYTAAGEGPFLRTGDQGFLQADGQLFVTGRLKDLLIIRGRNHYPQDIEQTVEQASPAPRAGCGAAFSVDVEGEERLVVVYEVDARRLPLDMPSVVGAIRQRVAEVHELPLHALVFIEPGLLPKTSSGKIQRRATRAAWLGGELRPVETWRAREDVTEREPTRAEARPETPETPEALEHWLRMRVASRLKVAPDELERDAPLTRYGVDSLAAVEVAHEVEKGLGLALPMEVLLGGPSLAELARRLWADTRPETPAAAPAAEGPPPLSFAQQRLWFLDQLEPGSPLYNLPAAVRLEGALDAHVLERCFSEVARRHESLRTSFPAGAQGPVQRVHPEGAVALARVDLGALGAGEREAEVLRLAQQEALRPFELAHGPLLRTTLLRLSDTEHVLVLCMHHIISDGASMGVLVREVAALYEAFREGRPSPLPEPRVQYVDHTRWQRERLQGEALASQLEWWRQQLEGAPTRLELTADRPRPPVRDSRGASHPVRLSRETWTRVQALARREGVTPFMLLLATFQTLLQRYSGQDDISVGSPIAGRGRAETEGLIGFFVNTLVLRTRLGGDPSFRELLARVREVTLGAYAHQDVPFEKLVETLRPVRDLSLSPLFQVMLILHPDPLPGFRLPGLTLSGVPLESRVAKYDLTLSFAESERGLEGTLEYATSLYDAATVARLGEHLGVLLEGVLAHPEARLSALPLLPAAERRQVVETWNQARPAPVVDGALHQLFERQVERTPEATVLVVGTRRLSYRELDARANQLAWHLRSLGVGPEVPVALCLERTELLPLALFAILKAGGAYMPLDPTYPAERLAFTLEDSRSPLLLTQRSLLPLADALHAPGRVLLDEPEAFAHLPVTRPPCHNGPGDLAYLLYTSGSTGRPKGVALEHRSAVAFVRWALETFTPAQLAGVLASTSVCFDLSVFELFVPPACGGCVYLADNALALPSLPAVSEVTLINTVPSAMAELVRQRAVPVTVHTVNLCGEPLGAPLAQAIHEAAAVKVLYNLYGPTEDTTYSTWTAVPPAQTATPHIGHPLPGTQAYVLDPHLRPVPIGVPGELFLGGVGLARGYLGRPELTAERFVPDPFCPSPGARLYRTGDRVYWRADGELEFLGRIDFQVKLRGFRVELGEVESVLLRHPTVRAVVAVVREDVPGDKRLVVYAVPRDGHALDAAALRAFVKQSVPDYMVPSAFVPMEAFPQTPNGKVDRKRLPVPEGAGLAPHATHVPPRTPTEQRLATLWGQVLQVPRVGRDDDFFALGGHSLLATQVVSRLRSAFGVELPLRVLFEAPTLEALAARLDAARQGPAPSPSAPRRSEDAGPPPLSFPQQRLWFLEQLTPGTATYNMPAAVRLGGPLDVAALQRSLEEVVRRHEPLRTTFHAEAGVAVQAVAPAGAWPLPVVDLTALPDGQREAEALRLAREEARAPFELSRGPLLRTGLLRLSDTEHVLLITLHHTVADGWSLGVLVRELAALYRALRQGESSSLPELPLRYADYARWQREWLQGEVRDTQLAYWTQRLAGAPAALELPHDRPRPAVLSSRGASVPVRLPRELMADVTALCQREGVTPFMVLLATFQALLARYSGQDDISVGTPIANRRHTGLEGLIGFFANTLVLRSRPSAGLSLRALLAQVRETTLGAYEHQDLPFEALVDALQPERDLSRTPLFQVLFSLQDALLPTLSEESLTLSPLAVDTGVAKFELTLELGLLPDGALTGGLSYNTDLFDAGTATRLVEHLGLLLRGGLDRPEAPLDTLPLLTDAERQVLVAWNDTRQPLPVDTCIHHLFEAQAQRSPDAPAIGYEGAWLTYAELDARANQLAWHLRSLGVGPEVRVALGAERSLEMVVGLLAILKAGGAYVPLDPAYPRERLEGMLEDARPTVLLAQPALLPRLPERREARVVPLRLEDDAWREQPRHAPEALTTPEHLAYVLFTSGSTGRPKGAMNTHRAVCNRLLWMQHALRLGPTDVVLQKTPYSFDVSVWEFFWPLLAGARLVLARPGGHQEPDFLLRLIAEQRVTTLHFVPSMLQPFLEQPELERCASLTRVVCSGEALSVELARRALERLPSARLYNLYGPTEAAVDVSVFECRREESRHSIPIGRPIANTTLHVLDAHLRPVAPGLAGELYIGGVQVGRGYFGRPDLTAERFIPDPFSPGARLYRTGDKARWGASGELEYLGRLDFQVKLRGLRIELGEIETALEQLPAVRQAVVTVREDTPGAPRLVAYLVPTALEQVPDDASLRAALQARLPEYMVPAVFVPLGALPLTSSGKVDRRALPAPERARPTAAVPTAPRDDTERRLGELWARVLGLPDVGIHDNFFALGGDSILGLQVVAHARQAGLLLSARDLFQHQTIAALARVARPAARGEAAEQGPVSGAVSLTPIQRELLEGTPEHAHHFNQSVLLRARQPLQAGPLEQALQALVTHHDALRLRFTRREGLWHQEHAAAPGPVRLLVHDLSALPAEARRAARLAETSRLQASFQLAEAPLVRAALFLAGDAEPASLFLAIHHLVVDAVSWRVLLEDLESAYLRLVQGQPVVLPARSTSFQAWTRHLTALAHSGTLAAQAPLPGAPRSEQLVGLPREGAGLNTRASERTVSVQLEPEETRLLLQETPGAWRARVDEVLLAALALTLGEWTGRAEVLVDVEGHGRQEQLFEGVDLSRTVGWFSTVTPVRLSTSVRGSAGDGLRAVRDGLRRVPHQGLGHGLLKWMGPDTLAEPLRAQPGAPVLFNYLGQFDAASASSTLFALTDEDTGPQADPSGPRAYLLEAVGSVLGGRLRLALRYSEHLHSASTLERLAGRYLHHLRAFISERHSPDARRVSPGDFPLARLESASLEALLSVPGDIEDVYPVSPLQHGLLFHWMLSPGADAYLQQLAWTMKGPLALDVFLDTWKALPRALPILRTSFHWERLEAPLQVVHSHVELPFELLDWRTVPAAEQQARFERLREEDGRRGFDPRRAPLMRLTAVRLGEDAWRLLWTHHHLLLDGWSLGALVAEVFSRYEALRSGGRAPPMSRPPFRDYIAWLQQRDARADEAWWRAYLEDFTAPTPLPADTGARTGSAPQHSMVERSLSAEASAALQAFVRQHQLTASTLALGAWALVLARYSGERDVLFGQTVAGRPPELPGAEHMVGLFINTLPTRVRVPEAHAPLLPWLHALQAAQVEQRQYEHTPLARIQTLAAVPRGAPLFESLVVFENYPLDAQALSSSSLRVEDVHAVDATHYPLSLTVFPNGPMRLRATYESARFERTALERLLGHWCQALTALADPTVDRLADLSLMSEAERQRVLVEWNDTRVERAEGLTLHGLVERQVERTPEAVALDYEGAQLTYRQLDARANQLARHLRSLGVGPEVRVGLFLERSLEMVVALLGTLKAGGAWVPLDPAYPAERLRYMVEDSAATVLLTQQRLVDTLPPSTARVVCLDSAGEAIGELSTEAVRSEVEGRHLAYVIYTSGSTGRPKGAMNEHAAICNRLLWMQEAYGLGAEERVLQKTPFSFDVSVWEFFWPLVVGARLVVARPGGHQEPGYLVKLMEREGITTAHFVPSMLQLFLEEPGLERLTKLQRLVSSGEALSAELKERCLERVGARLHNLYGPTEAAVDVTAWECERGEGRRAVPIGRPVANTRIYLLDERGEPVEQGVAGELYIGGVQVGRGYLGRPELTAERFVPDAYGEPGERLYRTGDRARYREDGSLEYLGRLDFQVKVRGLRIELGEIEAALEALPGVRECVVVVREDVAGDQRLVAYLVAQAGQTLETQGVRERLKAELPEYMVPTAFVVLDALPLSPSGKVERKALPVPGGVRAEREDTYVAPRDDMERELATLWGEVLGVPRVGVHDDFLSLGGHSLLATRLVSRVRQAFQVELPLKEFFTAPTVATLSLRILEAMAQVPADELASMMDELEQLDGDEVQQLLSSEQEDASEEENPE